MIALPLILLISVIIVAFYAALGYGFLWLMAHAIHFLAHMPYASTVLSVASIALVAVTIFYRQAMERRRAEWRARFFIKLIVKDRRS